MMNTTVRDLFNDKLPKALSSASADALEVARGIGAVYHFKVSGAGGGDWTLDLVSATPTCSPGLHGNANCTLEIDDERFAQMLERKELAMHFYFQGRLKVSGDPMLATKLSKLFALGGQPGASTSPPAA